MWLRQIMELTRIYLEQLADPQDLSIEEKRSRKGNLSQGHIYYGHLSKYFPIHRQAFKNLHVDKNKTGTPRYQIEIKDRNICSHTRKRTSQKN